MTKTNRKCFNGGYHCQALFISTAIKSFINQSIRLWKKKSKRKVRFKRIKPPPATARADKIFLTRGFLSIKCGVCLKISERNSLGSAGGRGVWEEFRPPRLACPTEAVRRREAEAERAISSFSLAANSFT